MASDPSYGNNGLFDIKIKGRRFTVQASDGMKWDHVSVSTHNRCPTWEEMCKIKDMFFDADEWVCQFHPAKEEHVNFHKYCLHMWRFQLGFVTPSTILVGPK